MLIPGRSGVKSAATPCIAKESTRDDAKANTPPPSTEDRQPAEGIDLGCVPRARPATEIPSAKGGNAGLTRTAEDCVSGRLGGIDGDRGRWEISSYSSLRQSARSLRANPCLTDRDQRPRPGCSLQAPLAGAAESRCRKADSSRSGGRRKLKRIRERRFANSASALTRSSPIPEFRIARLGETTCTLTGGSTTRNVLRDLR